jgi:hypothetical protein
MDFSCIEAARQRAKEGRVSVSNISNYQMMSRWRIDMIEEADIIATRSLTVRGEDGISIAAQARIGRPHRDDEVPGEENWVCEFEVVGPDGPIVPFDPDEQRRGPLRETSVSYGTDGMQALENALMGLGIALDGLGDRVSYVDVRGYHGLHKMIYAFSSSMERHLGKLVDDEMERIRREINEPGGAERVRARFPPSSARGRA